jgi:hypothetical protein
VSSLPHASAALSKGRGTPVLIRQKIGWDPKPVWKRRLRKYISPCPGMSFRHYLTANILSVYVIMTYLQLHYNRRTSILVSYMLPLKYGIVISYKVWAFYTLNERCSWSTLSNTLVHFKRVIHRITNRRQLVCRRKKFFLHFIWEMCLWCRL